LNTGLIDNHKHAGSVQIFDLDILLSGGKQVTRVISTLYFRPSLIYSFLIQDQFCQYNFLSF
jgi:hypothetical protein